MLKSIMFNLQIKILTVMFPQELVSLSIKSYGVVGVGFG